MSRTSAAAVFIGDIALDEYFASDTWAQPGDKGVIRTISTYVGGSIANAARVHAALGGDTEFISLINHGALTDRLLATLDAGGVDHAHMLYADDIDDQRNLIFLVDGEHVVLTPDVDERPMRLSPDALRELAEPGYVYLTLDRAGRLRSGESDAGDVLAALRAGGRRIVFDLDVEGLSAGDLGLIHGAHVVMMNDRGVERSFGAVPVEADVRAWLHENEVDMLLRSQAAAGATLYTTTETIVVPGYSVPVTDVTGAGDTLGGALVFGLGAGMPLRRAVSFAVGAASRSVMHLGPNGGVATVSEVERFMADQHAARGRAGEPTASVD